MRDLLVFFSLIGLVTSHTVLGNFLYGGKKTGSCLVPNDNSQNPIMNYDRPNGISTDAYICGDWKDDGKADMKCSVKAGDKVGYTWYHGGDDGEYIALSHWGPVMTFMAKADSMPTKGQNVWFKVQQEGIITYDANNWENDRWYSPHGLEDNAGKVEFTIPSDLAPGNYFVRAELIALHGGAYNNGAQPYVGCIELTVTGSGSAIPGSEYLSTIPSNEYANTASPGILYNAYKNPLVGGQNYPFPGKAVYKAGTITPPPPGPTPPPSTPSPSTPPPSTPSPTPAPATGSVGDVLMRACGNSAAYQDWTYDATNKWIKNANGYCLGYTSCNYLRSYDLKIVPCVASSADYCGASHWVMENKAIRPTGNAKACLDLYSNTVSEGSDVGVWECDNVNSVTWTIEGKQLKGMDYCVSVDNFNPPQTPPPPPPPAPIPSPPINTDGIIEFSWCYTESQKTGSCIAINEPQDPYTWDDNYLCALNTDISDWKWSNSGPITDSNYKCIQWLEGADPDGWDNNYLCYPKSDFRNYAFSPAGPIPAMQCTQILEKSDPNTWNDNYLCTSVSTDDVFNVGVNGVYNNPGSHDIDSQANYVNSPSNEVNGSSSLIISIALLFIAALLL